MIDNGRWRANPGTAGTKAAGYRKGLTETLP